MPKPALSKPGLVVRSDRPFNAEPPLFRLGAGFVTPVEDFYVRCHGTVPALAADEHRLRVDGLVSAPLDLSLAALRDRFPHHALRATVQCAGNRRADLAAVAPVLGNPWSAGAIGTADWLGVRLGDVLRAAGCEEGTGLHVTLRGLDECELPGERFRFAVSVPLAKALAPEVLLAWSMNGNPLAPEHGFPLRAVVPGHAGVRSVKWLAAVTVADRPCDGPMQQRDYKLFPPEVRAETVDWSRGLTINEMPVNAAICDPSPGAVLPPGPAVLRGWAMASGRAVARVDVSADGGRHWTPARLRTETRWSWTLWDATLPLPPGPHELAVRAWDEAGQTQPADPACCWNFKGYLSAAIHRVPVRVAAT